MDRYMFAGTPRSEIGPKEEEGALNLVRNAICESKGREEPAQDVPPLPYGCMIGP